jgi:spore germination cell wall hydrolase CwlJ-like protein
MLFSRTDTIALRLPQLPEVRHLLAAAVLATMFCLYLVAGFSVTSMTPGAERADARVPRDLAAALAGQGGPPKAEPLQFREVKPEDAVAINAAVPVSTLPNPAARPFAITFASDADRLRATECLTAAVYYEAATEPLDGQRAVAQVVLNRARHPAYPRTVCGVVFQGSERVTGCQFTFTCDGAIRRTPMAALWARARAVAEQALAGKVYAPVGWATHYHTNWVVPYWSSSLTKLALVGTHIFYRWEGGWGRPPAFRHRPAGIEPQIALMRHLTSDPSTLAQAPEIVPPVEGDPALAAAAAAGDAPLLPGVEGGTAIAPGAPRAIVRRYEPMTKEAATAAALARNGQPVSASMHWALSGLPAKPAATGEKRADAGAAPAAAAQPPKCLDGVRRLPSNVQGPVEKQAC